MFHLNRDIYTSWLRWFWSITRDGQTKWKRKWHKFLDLLKTYWKNLLSTVSLSRWVSAVWCFDSTEIQSMLSFFFSFFLLQPGTCKRSYLSGAVVDILSPALVPVGQQLNGGCGCAEPQQLWSLLIQETVIIEQVLVQHGSEEDMERSRSVSSLAQAFRINPACTVLQL